MSDVDDYAREVFESAKRFLAKAKESEGDDVASQAYLRASLITGCCYLECQVNTLCDHFSTRREFSVAEKSLLSEKDVIIKNGKFQLGNTKYFKLDDRILFLINRFSSNFDKDANDWWPKYRDAFTQRNEIVHPRAKVELSIKRVESALEGILGASDFLLRSVFNRPLPYATRGLTPKYDY